MNIKLPEHSIAPWQFIETTSLTAWLLGLVVSLSQRTVQGSACPCSFHTVTAGTLRRCLPAVTGGEGGGVEAAADRTCITEDYAGLRLPMFPLRRKGKEAAAAGTYYMFHPKYGRNMSQKVNLSFNAFFPIVVHSECGNKVFYIAAPTPCVNPLNDGLPRPNHMHCTWLRGGCNVAQFT